MLGCVRSPTEAAILRTALILLALLLLSIVPPAAPTASGIDIPPLHVGDVLVTEGRWWRSSDPEPSTWGTRLRTEHALAPEWIVDMQGTPRLAIPALHRFECQDCSPWMRWHEVGTGDMLRSWSGDLSTATVDDLPPNGLVQARRTTGAEEGWVDHLVYPNVGILRGRALMPGDVIERTTPRASSDSTWTFRAVAIGWEETELGELFRVDHTLNGAGLTSSWYAEGEPFPRMTLAGQDGTVRTRSHVVSWTPGDGAPLVDPTYAPPPHAIGMLRAPYTGDGPAGPTGARLELADAARLARSDPRALDFFATHPEAYAVRGDFHHDHGVAIWEIQYQQGLDRLSASVQGADGVGVVTQVHVGGATAEPAREVLVGQQVACWDELRRLIEEAPAVSAEIPWSGSFTASGSTRADVWCELSREGWDTELPAEVADRRTSADISATIAGVRGERIALSWRVWTSQREASP